MGILVEDLLLLARLDQQRPIEHRPVDLLVLAADAVQDTTMIAPGRAGAAGRGAGPGLPDQRGRGPAAPGHRQPDVQRAGPHAGRHRDRRAAAARVPARPPPYPGAPAVSVPAAVVEVVDHGEGLTAEQAQHVFERFYRADQARNRKSGGNGLGLAIVSALVAAHGGTATVESAPGQGATFRITLPLAAEATSARDQGAGEPGRPGGSSRLRGPAPGFVPQITQPARREPRPEPAGGTRRRTGRRAPAAGAAGAAAPGRASRPPAGRRPGNHA